MPAKSKPTAPVEESSPITPAIQEAIRARLPIQVNERVVAFMRNCAVQSLRNERFKGLGVPWYKQGRRVSYRLTDVLDYVERCRVTPHQLEG